MILRFIRAKSALFYGVCIGTHHFTKQARSRRTDLDMRPYVWIDDMLGIKARAWILYGMGKEENVL